MESDHHKPYFLVLPSLHGTFAKMWVSQGASAVNDDIFGGRILNFLESVPVLSAPDPSVQSAADWVAASSSLMTSNSDDIVVSRGLIVFGVTLVTFALETLAEEWTALS